jgi:hypothetical protein
MSKILAFLLSAILLTYSIDESPEMKKAKINIAPTIGVKEDLYVEVRFDKEEGIDLMECVMNNCEKIHKKVIEKYPEQNGIWRINRSVLDLVYDHYRNEKKTGQLIPNQ